MRQQIEELLEKTYRDVIVRVPFTNWEESINLALRKLRASGAFLHQERPTCLVPSEEWERFWEQIKEAKDELVILDGQKLLVRQSISLGYNAIITSWEQQILMNPFTNDLVVARPWTLAVIEKMKSPYLQKGERNE